MVAITFDNLLNATSGTTTIHQVTITDNDSIPVVGFDLATSTVAENGGTANIAVSIPATYGLDVTIPFTIQASSTAAAAP